MKVIVGGIIEKNGKYLLVQEAKKKCYKKWNFPAGHLDFNESLEQGAIRELEEELGVTTKENDLKFISIVKSTKNPKNHEFQYVYLLECNNKIENYIFEDEEVSEVKYVHFKDLEKMVEEKVEGLLLHDEEYKKLFKYIRDNFI